MSTSLQHEETLAGVLERILFYNEENHFCIGEVRDEKSENILVVTGNLPSVQCGETLLLKGTWVQHTQYGRQFKALSFESKLPSGVYGIRKYLGSGLVRGIGKTYAHKIVDHFGSETFRIISEESARLQEVEGIGKQRAKAIKKAWDEQRALRDIMIFLKTYGVSNNQCLRLVQRYGQEAQAVITQNPYVLTREIKGIGFKTADKIALNLGFASDSELRVRAGVFFELGEIEDEGHTTISLEDLRNKVIELLQIDFEIIETQLSYLINNKEIHLLPENRCQLLKTAKHEESLAKSIHRIQKIESTLPPILVPKAIEWAQEQAGISFAPEQIEAIHNALSHKLSIITGGPGTGKTTLLRALVKILQAKKIRITLAAPTGRAAQRMAESSGAYAQTLHRLLKFDPEARKFTHTAERPLNTDFIIIDETSMLDTELADYLFRAIPSSAHIVLVGDIHQLPSVGPGKVLQDLIASGIFTVTYLKHIFRQSERSSIVGTAHDILEGSKKLPIYFKSLDKVMHHEDLFFIEAKTPEDCLRVITQIYKEYAPRWFRFYNILQDIQVLAPMHKGTSGIANLNKIIQEAINPSHKSSSDSGKRFSVGDKVLQIRNNYDLNIFNGDLGIIKSLDSETGNMLVNFDDQEIEIDSSAALDLHLAYAISIHKSQGSEFPIVILPLLKQHFVMLQKKLLYTGVTRGRKKVIIVGDPVAYFMAISNEKSTVRQTALQDYLLKELSI